MEALAGVAEAVLGTRDVAAAASFVLGYAIVAASAALKLPQIFAIVSARSGEGLSLSMFEIETLCYSFSLGYAFRSGLPFNAWGETAFIAVQSYIIVMLLHMYAGAKGSSLRAMVMAVGLPATAYAALKPELVTDGLLETLFSSQNALLLAARLPQVYANFANGSTGQLSLVTTALMVAGGLVRIFTTMQEGGSSSMLMAYGLGTATNAAMALQIVWYAHVAPAKKKKKAE
eukprot:PRCOL_00005305-RA